MQFRGGGVSREGEREGGREREGEKAERNERRRLKRGCCRESPKLQLGTCCSAEIGGFFRARGNRHKFSPLNSISGPEECN